MARAIHNELLRELKSISATTDRLAERLDALENPTTKKPVAKSIETRAKRKLTPKLAKAFKAITDERLPQYIGYLREEHGVSAKNAKPTRVEFGIREAKDGTKTPVARVTWKNIVEKKSGKPRVRIVSVNAYRHPYPDDGKFEVVADGE